MEYGLIGEKLGHSYSKIIHEKLGEYTYDLIPLTPEEVGAFLQKRDFRGLNVTIPYKQTVMAYCDHISPLASAVGAVNTLYFDEKGKLWGTNTDYAGFLYAMDSAHISLTGKKVLILGDGATSGTIRKAASDRKASELFIASRKVKEPEDGYTFVSYEDLHKYPDMDIVINTTPVGMWPHTEGSPVDLRLFPSCQGVFDVIYNPYYTKFITQAADLNIPYASGLSMLVSQATAAAGYFTGRSRLYEKENERIIGELKASFTK